MNVKTTIANPPKAKLNRKTKPTYALAAGASKSFRKVVTKKLSKNTGLPKVVETGTREEYERIISAFTSKPIEKRTVNLAWANKYAKRGRASDVKRSQKKINRIIAMSTFMLESGFLSEIVPNMSDEDATAFEDLLHQPHFIIGLAYYAPGWYKVICAFFGLSKIMSGTEGVPARKKGWEHVSEAVYLDYLKVKSELGPLQQEIQRKTIEFKKSIATLKDRLDETNARMRELEYQKKCPDANFVPTEAELEEGGSSFREEDEAETSDTDSEDEEGYASDIEI